MSSPRPATHQSPRRRAAGSSLPAITPRRHSSPPASPRNTKGASQQAAPSPRKPTKPLPQVTELGWPRVRNEASAGGPGTGPTGGTSVEVHGTVPIPAHYGKPEGFVIATACDGETEEVLPDAVMTIGCQFEKNAPFVSIMTARPDADGALAAMGPPPKLSAVIRIDCLGFQPFTKKVKTMGKQRSLDLGIVYLTPRRIDVKGVLHESFSKVPIKNAAVSLSSSKFAAAEGTTDEQGAFLLRPRAGEYTLLVNSAADDTITKPFVLQRGSKSMDFGVLLISVKRTKVSGKLTQHVTDRPVSNATLLFKSGWGDVEGKPKSDGSFVVENVPVGATLTVNCKSCTGSHTQDVDLPSGVKERKGLNVLLTCPICVLRGIIRDGTEADVKGIAGAKVKCGSSSVTTDASGKYEFKVPQGKQALSIVAPGFYDVAYNLNLKKDSAMRDALMCPRLKENHVLRFILRWDEFPSDLDMYVRDEKNPDRVINYQSRTDPEIGAFLDCDVQKGYGPETITVTDASQKLLLWVNNYSGDAGWDASEAVVDVYSQKGHVESIHCALKEGSELDSFWHVLSTQNGEYTVINEISMNEP